MKRKLIEVALPLDKINSESAREKSIRHGHPSTLHLWWARRPLAAARAVIWSSLVDDPSSHPEEFPTEEEQNAERQRLFKIMEELVVWENSNNEDVLNAAKEEILKSTNGNPPALLDPFAGGGAIPLEAQRLGLEAHAHDLNPVAVMINKAMIEIPPRFSNLAPVNPEDNQMLQSMGWKGSAGLAKDVAYYGQWLKEEAFKQIGYLYPKVKVPKEQGGGEATVVAWIWARTVKCPNPACGCEIPLIKSTTLAKNKAYIDIKTNGSIATYTITNGNPSGVKETVNRRGATCIFCNSPVSLQYIRDQGKQNRISEKLIAVIAEGEKHKIYISPDQEQAEIAKSFDVADCQLGSIAHYPGYLNPPAYGLSEFEQLFTKRQQKMLTTFSDLIAKGIEKAKNDAIAAGLNDDNVHLVDNGSGATAYGEAIGVYLAIVIDKLTDYNSSICSWHNSREKISHTFGMTGISMTWDFAETNPFSNSSGCFDNMMNWVCRCLNNFNCTSEGYASQYDAQSDCGMRNIMISTDPPYYSNVPYADFSDFFYGWMRKSLRSIYPDLFSTVQVPKSSELVADPYRSGGKEEAATFFEVGMLSACRNMYLATCDDIPVTIYYAFKQSDISDQGETVSTGWEKMLGAIITSGFSIVGTWPIRTELANRTRGLGANALASSIVLVCRKRAINASKTTRRNLISSLRRELYPAIKKLQETNIAPVDLAQSAIGPGMAVFSRYSEVLEADGSPMTVRSALQVINEEIDLYFNEQVGSIDAASRFCVDLYSQYAFNDIKYGEAEVLANAKGASIPMMSTHGLLYAKAGIVHLLERPEIPEKVDTHESNIWLLTQQLTYAMEKGGIEACANIVVSLLGSNAEDAKDLAYRLYTIAEQKKWADEAYAYNALVVAWPDIQSRATELKEEIPDQITLDEF